MPSYKNTRQLGFLLKSAKRRIEANEEKGLTKLKSDCILKGMKVKMMAENIYSLKDIIRITGLDRNRIYYWSKTLAAVRPQYITPGRRLFNLRALLDFRLIVELLKLGLSPSGIEPVLWQASEVPKLKEKTAIPIWDVFVNDRNKYERDGFFLYSDQDQVVNFGDGPIFFDKKEKSAIWINLLNVIRDVEEKTGETLE